MPLTPRPRPRMLRTRLVRAAALSAAVLGAALPASASACTTPKTSQPFTQWVDYAQYNLAPAGSFEGGASGWTLKSASVVSGNESYKVAGSRDSQSLLIPATGTAITPTFCVSIANPTFRFFALRNTSAGGSLNVAIRYTDASGVIRQVPAGSITGDSYSTWQPSSVLALSSILPLWQVGATLDVQLVFDPTDTGSSWTIDDVYIDPYSR